MGGLLSSIGSIASGIGGLTGGSSSAGSSQLMAAEQQFQQQAEQDQLIQIQNQEEQDKIQTSSQLTTSWANTMNQIGKEFSDVSSAKTQADGQVAKNSSDATRQA